MFIHLVLLFASLAAGSALFPRADNSSSPSSSTTSYSTFFYGQKNANISVSLTAVKETGDLFFRFSATSQYNWAAFGIGQSMKGALTFVVYPMKNGSGMTVSPRLSKGHTEPTYAPNVNFAKLAVPDDRLANSFDMSGAGNFQVSAVCRNCSSLSDPPLDLSSSSAPFIFAFGPISSGANTRWSDDPAAPLRRHTMHGQFTMDMRQATVRSGEGVGIPPLGNSTSGASPAASIKTGHDYSSALHALFFCFAFGIILPLDALLVRVFKCTGRSHYIIQGFFSGFFLIGFIIGIYLSTQFVRSRSFSSPHQLLGILTLLVLLLQAGLGMLHRRHAVQIGDGKKLPPPKSLQLAHQVSAVVLLILGVVDVAIGFNFALNPFYNRLWAPLIIGVMVLVIFCIGMRRCWDNHSKDAKETARQERETEEAYKAYNATYGQGPAPGQPGYELHEMGSGREGQVQYQNVQFPKQY